MERCLQTLGAGYYNTSCASAGRCSNTSTASAFPDTDEIRDSYDRISLNKRSTHCDPNPNAEGSPHTVIEAPGPGGKYTTFNGDGTFKQYRGSGKDHGGIPRPNVKENGIMKAL